MAEFLPIPMNTQLRASQGRKEKTVLSELTLSKFVREPRIAFPFFRARARARARISSTSTAALSMFLKEYSQF